MLPPLPLPAAARVVRIGALQLRTPRSAAACAAPAPPLQLLRSTRLLAGRRRGVSRPPRGAASARQCVRASALSDDVLEDLQRAPEHRTREYLPHELLRAAVQLSDGMSHGGKAQQLRVSSYEAALLMRCTALLACKYLHSTGRHHVVWLEAMHNTDALHSDGSPALPGDLPAARARLLRLMDALEAAAPAVLRGTSGKIGTKPSPSHLAKRAETLASFAAHVPDSAWANAPETWEPPVPRSMTKQLRSFMDHIVGARFPVPPVLYNTFEAWRPGRVTHEMQLQRSFASVFVQAARGGSLRDALRAHFPMLCISRDTAHAFAATVPGSKALSRLQRLLSPNICETLLSEKYDSPFGALRTAQLQALGIDAHDAALIAHHLLPPKPCADAGEERLRLDAARFLVTHRLLSATKSPEEQQQLELDTGSGLKDGHLDIQSKTGVLSADLGFFLHAQLLAAETRGQPPADAFSFSGRTLASVTRLAAQHRRKALVAAVRRDAPRNGGFVASRSIVGSRQYFGAGRAPLEWDDACDQMLALARRKRSTDGASTAAALRSSRLPLADVRWSALVCAASAGGVRSSSSTLRGEWHMQQLRTWAAVRKEGQEQRNCLADDDHSFESTSSDSSYWSLRFTPDAAGQQQMEQKSGSIMQRSVASLRLTVHIADGRLEEARGPRNDMPPFAALHALAEWGRLHAAEVHMPRFTSVNSFRDYMFERAAAADAYDRDDDGDA